MTADVHWKTCKLKGSGAISLQNKKTQRRIPNLGTLFFKNEGEIFLHTYKT